MAQNEFRNALQAMSNSAASTVSAPVDGIAWLLRKAGIPIPGNALGGSDWMAQQGLTAPVRPGASQIAGDTLGLLAPMVAAAKAPQIARGLLQVGENALAPRAAGMVGAERGAIVYHGSPHKFDAFDSSKIGTGEGAQAYGHGLYLAESPDVAKQYQDALKGLWMVDGVPRQQLNAAEEAIAKAGSKAAALAKQDAWIPQVAGLDPGAVAGAQKFRDEIARTAEKTYEGGGSNLYKVDLPDEKIARMLDWDKPLSQQAPEVQKAAAMFGPKAGDLTGQELYKKAAGFDSMVNVAMKTGGDVARLKSVFPQASDSQIAQAIATAKNAGGNDRIAAQMLRDAGIPGIRYLDGGSRSAGAGSSNFVVFPGEENALRILERNGQPLGLLGK